MIEGVDAPPCSGDASLTPTSLTATGGLALICSATPVQIKTGPTGTATFNFFQGLDVEIGLFPGGLTGIFNDPFAFTVVDPNTGEPISGVTVEASDGYEFPVNASSVAEPCSPGLCLLGSAGIAWLLAMQRRRFNRGDS